MTTEKVDRMFRCLNRALFEGRDSGSAQTDKECREWALTFPHLQLVVHVLPSPTVSSYVVPSLMYS